MQIKTEDRIIYPTGMVEGKHYIFRCSSCDAPLADVMVNYDKVDAEWNIVAECCHCGDKSYVQTINGKFLIGNNEEIQKYTAIADTDICTDLIVIKTVKVGDYVKKRN